MAWGPHCSGDGMEQVDTWVRRCLSLGGKWSRSGPGRERTEDGVTGCLPSMETRQCRSREAEVKSSPRASSVGGGQTNRPAWHLPLGKRKTTRARMSLSVPHFPRSPSTYPACSPRPRPSVLCHPHPIQLLWRPGAESSALTELNQWLVELSMWV